MATNQWRHKLDDTSSRLTVENYLGKTSAKVTDPVGLDAVV